MCFICIEFSLLLYIFMTLKMQLKYMVVHTYIYEYFYFIHVFRLLNFSISSVYIYMKRGRILKYLIFYLIFLFFCIVIKCICNNIGFFFILILNIVCYLLSEFKYKFSLKAILIFNFFIFMKNNHHLNLKLVFSI